MMEPEEDLEDIGLQLHVIVADGQEDDNDLDPYSLVDASNSAPAVKAAENHDGTHKKLAGASLAGGITGGVLTLPLLAVDVTALAIALPIVAVAAAGGCAYIAAAHSASETAFLERPHNSVIRSGTDIDDEAEMKELYEDEHEVRRGSDVSTNIQNSLVGIKRGFNWALHKKDSSTGVSFEIEDLNETVSRISTDSDESDKTAVDGRGSFCLPWMESCQGINKKFPREKGEISFKWFPKNWAALPENDQTQLLDDEAPEEEELTFGNGEIACSEKVDSGLFRREEEIFQTLS